MANNIVTGIYNTLRNSVLNGLGVDRDLSQLLMDGDVSRARGLMQDRDVEVAEAIEEYRPETHKVMERRDKPRKGKEPYRVEKLPRRWQAFINEVALFFLLGNPIKWSNKFQVEDGAENPTQAAFDAFERFLSDNHFNAWMREAKRLAGAETESAMLFHVYRNESDFTPEVKILVIAKSKGYALRPLFDQYGNLLAFGYGYYLKEGNRTVEHFDIQTPTVIYNCKRGAIGWEVDSRPNPTGKINVIYFRQDKEWEGTQWRIERDEAIDSKTADTNNYFADPKLKITADVISSLPDSARDVGEVIQMQGNGSVVEYLAPPTAPEMKNAEKEVLRQSILQDSFTPDFSYENMKGIGTLSGEALRRALILGYMKRENHLERYDELVKRIKSLVLAIMSNVTHISLRDQIAKLDISHSFSEPFMEDANTRMAEIGRLYGAGVISLKTAVSKIGLAGDIDKEIELIKSEKVASANSVIADPNSET